MSLPLPTRSQVSLEHRWAQQQQQQHQPRAGRSRQRRLTRVGAAAAPQLRLAAPLLALQARVARGAAAADVVDALPAVLAAQELVVTHPGWRQERGVRVRQAWDVGWHFNWSVKKSLSHQIPEKHYSISFNYLLICPIKMKVKSQTQGN